MFRNQLRNSNYTAQSHKQPLNISVTKAAKKFKQNQYNNWFSNEVSVQLKKGIDPANKKISSNLST